LEDAWEPALARLQDIAELGIQGFITPQLFERVLLDVVYVAEHLREWRSAVDAISYIRNVAELDVEEQKAWIMRQVRLADKAGDVDRFREFLDEYHQLDPPKVKRSRWSESPTP